MDVFNKILPDPRLSAIVALAGFVVALAAMVQTQLLSEKGGDIGIALVVV